jgi:DNA-binding MarR family transcriptional regulator
MSTSVRRRPAASPVDTERLGAAITALVRATRREIALPLGASTVAALRTIVDQGPLRTGDLARHEGVTGPTLSRIVAVLEDEGCIERTADTQDRRVVWLEATASGRRLLDEVARERARVFAERVARLTPEQTATLAAALDAIEALAAD